MPINRTLWQSTLNSGWVPQWPCPRCGSTALDIVKDSLHTGYDAQTAECSDDPDFDYDSATGRFSCLLRC